MGFEVIPAMDSATFLSSSNSNANCMAVSFYDHKADVNVVKFNIGKLMKTCPKFYCRIVEFAGDYYY